MAASATVDSQSDAVAKMAKDWELIDDLCGGTAAMRKAGKKYLPQFPQEEGDVYTARLKQAVLFPAFQKTTSTLSSKPLSHPIKVDDVSSQISDLLTNVDMFGSDIQSFMGQIVLACLRHGLDGVLVDMPSMPNVGRARSVAEEKAVGARPYMVRYPATSILGWRAERNADGAYLAQIRLMETIIEPDGEWGEKTVRQVRVLEPGKWATYREDKSLAGDQSRFVPYENGITTLPVVPFVFFYGIPVEFGIGAPPLLELAHMNVEHWQNASDQQNILHVARVPVLFAKGFGEGDNITIGASTAVTSTSAESQLSYVEHSGAAIGAGRQSLLDLEDRMRQVGAELLLDQPGILTATQIQSEDEGNRSILSQIAENAEDSLEQCLKLMSMWVGDKDAKPTVELFKDFGSAGMTGEGANLLMRAANDGHISSQTVFERLQRMDVIDPQDTFEEEQKRIDAETETQAKRNAVLNPPDAGAPT